jgi:hypothetical protein
MHHTLQRHNNENSKQIFTEKEFRGLSPNFHIHAPVSDLYSMFSPTIGLPLFCCRKSCGPIMEIETEAAQFLFWEYINWIFVAVQARYGTNLCIYAFIYSSCQSVGSLRRNKLRKIRAPISQHYSIKGTVSRDFLLLVFFINQFPPNPRVSHQDRFEFFRNFAEIFAAQG